jgi:hypothetical protein
MEPLKLYVPALTFVKDAASVSDEFDCLVVVSDNVQAENYPGKSVLEPLFLVCDNNLLDPFSLLG